MKSNDLQKKKYHIFGVIFQAVCLSANIAVLLFLGAIIVDVFVKGWPTLTSSLILNFPSRVASQAGLLSALVGTFYMMLLTALIAIPFGVGAAIYLEEYARNTWFVRLIKLNILNLAGIPSIIYGMLGLTIFVRYANLERSLLAGACTMAILVLPIITIAAQEALRAVPQSFRLSGYGIGMTRWQVIRYQVFPMAASGMITGVILALSRAIGESAPLILVGALTFVSFLPASPMDSFTVLSIQIYNWVGYPQKEFHAIAGSGIIVLLILLVLLNLGAIVMRSHFQKKLKGVLK